MACRKGNRLSAMRAVALTLATLVSLACAAAPQKVQAPGGALAYHRESGSFGYSVSAATPRIAKTQALAQCGNPKCEVVASLRNDCGAIANGPKRFYVSRGATRQEAETKALRLCGERCSIAGWACTR